MTTVPEIRPALSPTERGLWPAREGGQAGLTTVALARVVFAGLCAVRVRFVHSHGHGQAGVLLSSVCRRDHTNAGLCQRLLLLRGLT